MGNIKTEKSMSNTAPGIISKERFVSAINALSEQYIKDKHFASQIGDMFKTEVSGIYDSSTLSNTIIDLLRIIFPVDEDGHCEITHYCYCLNFGAHPVSNDKGSTTEYESPEQLYDRLINDKKILWFDTPDKGKLWLHVDPFHDTEKALLPSREIKRTASEMYEAAKTSLEIISGKTSPDETI